MGDLLTHSRWLMWVTEEYSFGWLITHRFSSANIKVYSNPEKRRRRRTESTKFGTWLSGTGMSWGEARSVWLALWRAQLRNLLQNIIVNEWTQLDSETDNAASLVWTRHREGGSHWSLVAREYERPAKWKDYGIVIRYGVIIYSKCTGRRRVQCDQVTVWPGRNCRGNN